MLPRDMILARGIPLVLPTITWRVGILIVQEE